MRVSHFALLVGAFAMAGCVSDTARVKMEIERLVKEKRFDDARAFRVKTDPSQGFRE